MEGPQLSLSPGSHITASLSDRRNERKREKEEAMAMLPNYFLRDLSASLPLLLSFCSGTAHVRQDTVGTYISA